MEYALSIEQVNFDADDSRCMKQNIDSFSSLVNYESEFPNQTSPPINRNSNENAKSLSK